MTKIKEMMTLNIKTVLLASLIVAMILPLSMMQSATANVVDDEFLLMQYDKIFPNHKNISDAKKIKVINSMMNGIEIELSVPENQDIVAKDVKKILDKIEKTNDKNEKKSLESQIKSKQKRMLEVGLVVAEDYKKDPTKWDEELDKHANSAERTKVKKDKDLKLTSYNGGKVKITNVSGEPFKGTVYQKFWCHSGLLLCTSTTYNNEMHYGDTFSPIYTLPSYSWYGNLVPYHKVKNTSGISQSNVDMESWVSVKKGSNWVASCYDDNTFNFSPSKTHYWSVCVTPESDPGNKIYHTMFIN